MLSNLKKLSLSLLTIPFFTSSNFIHAKNIDAISESKNEVNILKKEKALNKNYFQWSKFFQQEIKNNFDNSQSIPKILASANNYNPGDDFDGDGIINSIDIDDDNDGILDTDEANISITNANAGVKSTTSISNVDGQSSMPVTFNGSGKSITATLSQTGGRFFNRTDASDIVAFSEYGGNFRHQNWNLDFGANPVYDLELYFGNLENASNGDIKIGNFIITLEDGRVINGADFSIEQGNSHGFTSFEANAREIFKTNAIASTPTIEATYQPPSTGRQAEGTLSFNDIGTSKGVNGVKSIAWTIDAGTGAGPTAVLGIYAKTLGSGQIITEINSDADGIPNRFDLDSDGDGCSDAYESGATTDVTADYQFTGADANNDGFVDAVDENNDGVVDYTPTYAKTTDGISACTIDTDGDGVLDRIEDAGPNNGDGNGDGILDSLQGNVASLPAATTTAYVTAEAIGNCKQIFKVSTLMESELTEKDPNFRYPLGLVNISLNCLNPGESADITYFWHGVKSLDKYVYRKYGAATPGDTEFVFQSNVTTTYETKIIGTEAVSTATYTLTDGLFGDDTIQDGEIVDPVGPATPLADVDGDGISDGIDLDDDNDGILDTVEVQRISLNNVTAIPAGTIPGDPKGLMLSDDANQYNLVIYLATGSKDATFSTSDGYIYGGGLKNADIVELVYTTEYSPTKYNLSDLGIADIRSLSGRYDIRDSYAWSEQGEWTLLGDGSPGQSRAGVVSIDPLDPHKVGSVVIEDVDGPYDLDELEFTHIYNKNPLSSSVLSNYTGDLNFHNINFKFKSPKEKVSLYLFNSAKEVDAQGMIWQFNSKATILVGDADNDGILNHLDLDSDNDGCSDAYEAGTTTDTIIDFQFDGSNVGANGFEDTVETNPESGIYKDTYTYDKAIDGTCIIPCTDPNKYGPTCDFDGDGILNKDDLDDDNDGILDADEQDCVNPSFPLQVVDIETFGAGSRTVSDTPLVSVGVDFIQSTDFSMSDGEYSLTHTAGYVGNFSSNTQDGTSGNSSGNYDDQFTYKLKNHTGDANGYMLAINGSSVGQEVYRRRFTDLSPNTNVNIKFYLANIVRTIAEELNSETGFLKPILRIEIQDASKNVIASNIIGDDPTESIPRDGAWHEFQFNLNVLANSEIDFVLYSDQTSGKGNDFGLDDISLTYTKLFCDTDGTDNPNYLDLDSDNDGCSDAYEAGTTTDTIIDFQFDGSNVGANGFEDTVETNPESGIYKDTYTYDKAIDGTCIIPCTDPNKYGPTCDFDGDGILNKDDLDDDNDGILDTDECNGKKTIELLNATVFKDLNSAPISGTQTGLKFDSSPTDQNGYFKYIDVQSAEVKANGNINIAFFKSDLVTGDKGTLIIDADKVAETNGSFIDSNRFIIGDIDAEKYTFTVQVVAEKGPITDISDMTIAKFGGTGTLSAGIDRGNGVFEYTVTGPKDSSTKLDIKSTKGNLLKKVTFTVKDIPNYSGDIIFFRFLNTVNTCVNTDGTDNPNYLDLDSDNDGCPDAMEASVGGILESNDSIAKGPYGENGLADGVETSPESGIVNYTSTYSYALTDSVNGCIDPCTDPSGVDSDGDGVNDECDMDSDNDGILNSQEGICYAYTTLDFDTQTVGSTIASISPMLTSEGVSVTITDTVSDPSIVEIKSSGIGKDYMSGPNDHYIDLGMAFTGTPGEEYRELKFKFDKKVSNLNFYISDIDQRLDQFRFSDVVKIIPRNNGTDIKVTQSNADMGTAVAYIGDNTFAGTTNNIEPANKEGKLSINLEGIVVDELVIRYSSGISDPSPTAQYIGVYNLSFCTVLDSDNDGVPNFLDLDSDNDGIYDVVEAGGTDANNDGEADNSTGNYIDNFGIPDSTGFGLTPRNTVTETDPDYLNSDSDGDGCSDTNEAYNNLNTDTNNDGTYDGVITAAEVDENGLVKTAAYTTPNTNYTTVDYKNSVCYVDHCSEPSGVDTDKDGVNDICDIDMDNDGVLNSDENCNTSQWGTAPWLWTAGDDLGTITISPGIDLSVEVTTTASGNLDVYGGTAIDLANQSLGGIDDLGVYFDPDADQGKSPVSIKVDFTEKMYNLNFKITDIDGGNLGFRLDKVTVTSDVGTPILQKVSDSHSSFTIENNSATALKAISSNNNDVGTVLVIIPDGAKSITILYEEMGTISDPNGRGIGILGELNYCLDTDKDGIVDAKDLDSDNDGCSDALEANFNPDLLKDVTGWNDGTNGSSVGFTNAQVAGHSTTEYGDNGLSDVIETDDTTTATVVMNNYLDGQFLYNPNALNAAIKDACKAKGCIMVNPMNIRSSVKMN